MPQSFSLEYRIALLAVIEAALSERMGLLPPKAFFHRLNDLIQTIERYFPSHDLALDIQMLDLHIAFISMDQYDLHTEMDNLHNLIVDHEFDIELFELWYDD